jgi:hypothetical protein
MEDRFATRHRLSLPSGDRALRRIGGSMLLALAALLCLSFSACGGSGKHSMKSSPSASTSAVTTSAARAPSQTVSTGSGGGSTSSHSVSTAQTTSGGGSPGGVAAAFNAMPSGDQDGDAPNNKAFDKDDGFITTFGHPAGPADVRAITSLVTRYYAAIAKADGATACKLLFFVIVESAAETYGQTEFDATAGRRKSCGPVMSKVFKGSHRQLVVENRALKVIAIRVLRKRAWVLLRFGPQSVRRMVVYREGSSWKVGELLDTQLV